MPRRRDQGSYALQTLLVWQLAGPFLRYCRRRYGPTFTVRAYPEKAMVYVTDLADLKAVFAAPPDVLHAGETNAILGPVRSALDPADRRGRAPAPSALDAAILGRFSVAGYDLPAGVTLMPAIGLIHQSDLFPDPAAFQPERFLDETLPPYGWISFGGGRRRCLGAAFAALEMRLVIERVLAHVQRSSKARGEWALPRHITLVPARGARLNIRHNHDT